MALRLSPPCRLTSRVAGTAARLASTTAAAMRTALPAGNRGHRVYADWHNLALSE